MKIIAYTDGACSGNPGPGGWGAVVITPGDKFSISGFEFETTNNRMELRAAIEALKIAIDIEATHLAIYSDSAYVVNAVNNYWLENWTTNNWKTRTGQEVKNKDLWIAFLGLKSKLKTKFIKVKGHSGNRYNDEADDLAKMEIQVNLK